MRDALLAERSRIAELLAKAAPGLAAPLDLLRSKPVRRIPVPAHQLPGQSYIGLIIGPRGNTQKRMEAETGTKISIKGKGMRGSANQPGEEDEPMHVHITGDTEEAVEAAAAQVMALFHPTSEEALTAHKEKQLRELALINGTLREDEYCPVCGDKGHRQFECPARAKSFQAAGVKCSVCGDGSHPTRDCPLRQGGAAPDAGTLDAQYDSLMAELSGAPLPSKVSIGDTTGGLGSSSSLGATPGAVSGGSTIKAVHETVTAAGKKQTVIVQEPDWWMKMATAAPPVPAYPPGYLSGAGLYPPGAAVLPYASNCYAPPVPPSTDVSAVATGGYYYDPTTGQYYMAAAPSIPTHWGYQPPPPPPSSF
jgi:splicing factor 1